MKYRTQYDRIEVFTEKGDPIKKEYQGKFDKNGHIVVYEKGKKDLYAYIQSFAESVDINVIIKRYVNGDSSVLNQRVGEYIDTTNFPQSYAELLNVVNSGTDLFNKLPIDIKRRFNNNVNEFISTIGTDDWNNKMNLESEINNGKDNRTIENNELESKE